MAGIGNYVHYKKTNYRKFGTTVEGPSNYGSATAIFHAQKEAAKNNILSTKSKNLGSLENYLNGLMYPKENKLPSGFDEQIFQQFQQKVYSIFEEKFSSFGVNWGQGGQVYSKGKQKIENKSSIEVKTLQQHLAKLQDLAARMVESGEAKDADINLLKHTIDRVQSFIKQCQSDNIVKINLNQNAGAQEIISEINKAIKLETLPYAAATGEIFEDFLAVAGLYADGKAEEITDELLKKVLVGSIGRSEVVIDSKNFDSKYVKGDLLQNSGAFNRKGQLNDYTDWSFSGGKTQDKLDVVINWKGDQINASAKNYALKDKSSMIHLVSGTSLLYLIQNESPDFVNHWLNTVTTSGSSDTIAKSNLKAAHDAMKMTILVKSLTGQGLGRKGVADTFILNHRGKKHIYVWSMSQVVDSCSKVLDAIKFKGYPNTISNTWVGSDKKVPSRASAEQRISNLIAKLHTYKISVSIPQSALSLK